MNHDVNLGRVKRVSGLIDSEVEKDFLDQDSSLLAEGKKLITNKAKARRIVFASTIQVHSCLTR